MRSFSLNLPRLAPLVLLLFLNAACSGTNLGQIDESVDSREEMPGPGIFSDDEGESSLKWNELRSNGAESAEYQEFQQWLEYQKFKSSQ